MSMENTSVLGKQIHHERQELCTNRPRYRQGRKLTAVKVYSVVDESQYLLIDRVPAIAVTAELETMCQGFGSIEYLKHLPDYPTEKFCEVYQVKFHTIQSARFAKRKMDDRNFYGGTLHVCYAPELETLDDTRLKLKSRRQEIKNKLKASQTQKQKEAVTLDSVKIVQVQSSSLLMKEPILTSNAECFLNAEYSNSEERQIVTLVGKQSLPVCKPPAKRIVYHIPSKSPRQTLNEGN